MPLFAEVAFAMSRPPLRPCPVPYCRRLIRAPQRRCREHETQADRSRGTATERGYTSVRWRVFRDSWLERHPWCGDRLLGSNPQHSRCVQLKQRRRATDVDHIVRMTGPRDPRFFDPAAVQSLCHSCHARKTGTEGGAR